MDGSQPAKLFRHGARQAVDIPQGFELAGEDVTIRKEGERLIIETSRPKKDLLELLAEWAAEGPLEEHERMPEILDSPPRPFDF